LPVCLAYIPDVPDDIKSQTKEELEARFEHWGQPAYRVAQVLEWLYVHRVTDWEAMSNLPKVLRERLRAEFSLRTLQLVREQGARDTTQKFLWRLADGALIESVLIPANPALYGEASDRHTLCVSTQVGCAYGCKFCASGLDGWKRNLTPDEIVEQVMAVERVSGVRGQGAGGGGEHPTSNIQHPASIEGPERLEAGLPTDHAPRTTHPPSLRFGAASHASRFIDNLVIMGMGEPLANYDHLLQSLRILNAPWGGGIGARKITISTSGLAPQIRRLGDEPEQFRLAISLHGATDEVRNQIMPVNRRYPLKELIAACEHYQSQKGRMITLEYLLIAGVNDSLEQARPLAALARRLFAKVNLIPYNRVEGLPWERPTEGVCEAFLTALKRQRVTATLRREKGHDIDAACGQLRLKTERELNRSNAG
jgi:23S rRNA (adenine2503-C2)-methyltransferase